MSSTWFVRINNKDAGPLTSGDLRTLARQGKLKPSDLIRMGADGQWTLASKVQGLVFHQTSINNLPAPKPPPSSSESPSIASRNTNIQKAVAILPSNVQPETSRKARANKSRLDWRKATVTMLGLTVCVVIVAALTLNGGGSDSDSNAIERDRAEKPLTITPSASVTVPKAASAPRIAATQRPALVTLPPDETLKRIYLAFPKGSPEDLWDTLPPSYQKDIVHGLAQFADNVDREVWEAAVETLRKAALLIQEKHHLLFPPMPGHDLTKQDWEIRKSIADDFKFICDELLNSDLASPASMKDMSPREFLANPVKRASIRAVIMFTKLETLQKDNQPIIPQLIVDLNRTEFQLVRQSGDKATVRVIKRDGESTDEEMVLVEGRWIPDSLRTMGQLREEGGKKIATSAALTSKRRQDFLVVLRTINNGLDSARQATTQEDLQRIWSVTSFEVMAALENANKRAPFEFAN